MFSSVEKEQDYLNPREDALAVYLLVPTGREKSLGHNLSSFKRLASSLL